MAHQTKVTRVRKKKFLEHLGKTANVTESAHIVGIARKWLKRTCS